MHYHAYSCISLQTIVSSYSMSLSTIPHYSHISNCFFFYCFSTSHTVPFYYFIFLHTIFQISYSTSLYIFPFFSTSYHHLNLKIGRTTTRVIKSVDYVLGFKHISHLDKDLLTILIGELIKFWEQRMPTVCLNKQARTAQNWQHQSTTSVALTKDHLIVLYTNADVLTSEKKRELGVYLT